MINMTLNYAWVCTNPRREAHMVREAYARIRRAPKGERPAMVRRACVAMFDACYKWKPT